VPTGPDNPDGSASAPPVASFGANSGSAEGVERYADALVELNALLGRGTRYSGKLQFEGRIRIEGAFDGDIRGDDVLVIGQGAEVAGTIEVGVCIVTGGNVNANIRAREAIELHAPGRVKGDLHAPNIFIDRGVQFEGNCKMAPLDAPDAAASSPDAAPATADGVERTTDPGPPLSTPPDSAAQQEPDKPQDVGGTEQGGA